jgi:hypothetical protein
MTSIEILEEFLNKHCNPSVCDVEWSDLKTAIYEAKEMHKAETKQQEISDEEIEKSAEEFYPTDDIYREMWAENRCWQMGAKWYREQLKQK